MALVLAPPQVEVGEGVPKPVFGTPRGTSGYVEQAHRMTQARIAEALSAVLESWLGMVVMVGFSGVDVVHCGFDQQQCGDAGQQHRPVVFQPCPGPAPAPPSALALVVRSLGFADPDHC